MQARYITLSHPVTQKLAQPEDSRLESSLSLVIGTANSLYRMLESEDESKNRINQVIIEIWLDETEKVLRKLEELQTQIGVREIPVNEGSQYLRLSVADTNQVAENLLAIFQQFDQIITLLTAHKGESVSDEKYDKVNQYFSEKIRMLLDFPYRQNLDLQRKLIERNI